MTNNPEAFFPESDSDFSGTGTHAGTDPAVLNDLSPGTYTRGSSMSTLTGENHLATTLPLEMFIMTLASYTRAAYSHLSC